MSIHARLLESLDPNDWHENPVDERLRQDLGKHSSPVLIRQLYPLRARLLQKCPFDSKTVGHVYEYARASWKPSQYPIQVLDLEGSTRHQWCFSSNEAELLPAE